MKDMYSLKDIAKMMNISVKTMKIRVSTGKFPPPDIRKEGKLYWTPAALPEMTSC